MKEISTANAFKALLKQQQNLLDNKHYVELNPNSLGAIQYWKSKELFTQNLAVFINHCDFSNFKGKDILKICALVSTYRPMQLHSFLMRCSQLSQHSLTNV